MEVKNQKQALKLFSALVIIISIQRNQQMEDLSIRSTATWF